MQSKEYKRNHHLSQTYKISSEQYNVLFWAQGGVCAICKQPETSKRFKNLAVDHDHATGIVRGLLCHHCNKALGNFFDSIDNLKAAIAYLNAPRLAA